MPNIKSDSCFNLYGIYVPGNDILNKGSTLDHSE